MHILREAIRQLNRVGGADIMIVDGKLYEITAQELHLDTVQQAVKNLVEERGNERTAD